MTPRIVLALFFLAFTLPLRADDAAAERNGIVFVVGGVGRLDPIGPVALHTLPKAGVEHELREFVWTYGFGMALEDLQFTNHQHERVVELAGQILRYRKQHPRRPIYLVAKSGGTGIALFAASRLPPKTLERIILIAPAVSPGYDLRPALRATRQEIVNYWSKGDWLILGWGTSQFGTMDRVYGPSAGLVGFQRPSSGDDLELYDRLVQIHWTRELMKGGHAGGHISTSMPVFVAKEVARWLR